MRSTVSVCRMFNHAIAGERLPKHVSTDHDSLFRFHRWLANLRVLAINDSFRVKGKYRSRSNLAWYA
jgi:hypothetical protein